MNEVRNNNIRPKDTVFIASSLVINGTAIDFIAYEWNLETRKILTESLTEKMINKNLEKIETNNTSLWNKLDSLKNTDSEFLFNQEVDDEIIRIKLAQQLLDSNLQVQNFLKTAYGTGEFVVPSAYSKSNNTEYIWRMWRVLLSEKKNKFRDGAFADFKIDLKKNTVNIIKIEK